MLIITAGPASAIHTKAAKYIHALDHNMDRIVDFNDLVSARRAGKEALYANISNHLLHITAAMAEKKAKKQAEIEKMMAGWKAAKAEKKAVEEPKVTNSSKGKSSGMGKPHSSSKQWNWLKPHSSTRQNWTTKPLQDILQKKYNFDDRRIIKATVIKKVVKKGMGMGKPHSSTTPNPDAQTAYDQAVLNAKTSNWQPWKDIPVKKLRHYSSDTNYSGKTDTCDGNWKQPSSMIPGAPSSCLDVDFISSRRSSHKQYTVAYYRYREITKAVPNSFSLGGLASDAIEDKAKNKRICENKNQSFIVRKNAKIDRARELRNTARERFVTHGQKNGQQYREYMLKKLITAETELEHQKFELKNYIFPNCSATNNATPPRHPAAKTGARR